MYKHSEISSVSYVPFQENYLRIYPRKMKKYTKNRKSRKKQFQPRKAGKISLRMMPTHEPIQPKKRQKTL